MLDVPMAVLEFKTQASWPRSRFDENSHPLIQAVSPLLEPGIPHHGEFSDSPLTRRDDSAGTCTRVCICVWRVCLTSNLILKNSFSRYLSGTWSSSSTLKTNCGTTSGNFEPKRTDWAKRLIFWKG